VERIGDEEEIAGFPEVQALQHEVLGLVCCPYPIAKHHFALKTESAFGEERRGGDVGRDRQPVTQQLYYYYSPEQRQSCGEA